MSFIIIYYSSKLRQRDPRSGGNRKRRPALGNWNAFPSDGSSAGKGSVVQDARCCVGILWPYDRQAQAPGRCRPFPLVPSKWYRPPPPAALWRPNTSTRPHSFARHPASRKTWWSRASSSLPVWLAAAASCSDKLPRRNLYFIESISVISCHYTRADKRNTIHLLL